MKRIAIIAALLLAASCSPKIAPTESAATDTDLYDSLNLLVPAKDDWYTARLEVSEEGRDHPNVFFRGGSFLGQSTAELIRAGVFGEDVHLENNNLFRNRFTQITGYASYTAYDEMPLGEMLPSSDILVLEINESSIHVMGFGFIEYLLEHPELMGHLQYHLQCHLHMELECIPHLSNRLMVLMEHMNHLFIIQLLCLLHQTIFR